MNGGAHPIGGVVPLGGGAKGQRLAHHGQVVRPGGPVQQQLRAQRSQAVRRRHPAGLALSVRRLLNGICCITQQILLLFLLMKENNYNNLILYQIKILGQQQGSIQPI